MMRLKIEKVEEGLHPNELVVSVRTKAGPVLFVIDSTTLYPDDTVGVGWPVGKEDDFYLVQLPREAFQGSSRVWVAANELRNGDARRKAAG